MLFCEGIVDDGEVAGLDERELVVALGFGLGFWVRGPGCCGAYYFTH